MEADRSLQINLIGYFFPIYGLVKTLWYQLLIGYQNSFFGPPFPNVLIGQVTSLNGIKKMYKKAKLFFNFMEICTDLRKERQQSLVRKFRGPEGRIRQNPRGENTPKKLFKLLFKL